MESVRQPAKWSIAQQTRCLQSVTPPQDMLFHLPASVALGNSRQPRLHQSRRRHLWSSRRSNVRWIWVGVPKSPASRLLIRCGISLYLERSMPIAMRTVSHSGSCPAIELGFVTSPISGLSPSSLNSADRLAFRVRANTSSRRLSMTTQPAIQRIHIRKSIVS